MERVNSYEDIKYNSFVIICFRGGDQAEAIYNKMLSNKCDIVGVNCVEPNICAAICRRAAPRSKFDMSGFTLDHVYVVKHVQGRRRDDFNKLIVAVLKAWMRASLNSKVNLVRLPR